MTLHTKNLIISLLLLGLTIVAECYSVKKPEFTLMSRRSVFAVPLLIAPAAAMALDIDSFVQKELDNGTCNEKIDKKCKPKLSDDQALCRFGQPSQETGEACVRAGMSTSRATGSVDAFGKIDRGDYVRCKAYWVDGKSGKLEKEWRCT